MKRAPRFLFWSILLLTVLSVWINFPVGQDKVFKLFHSDQRLFFREGLDLQGGSSITFRADMSKIASDQRNNALNSARTIIEKRVNLFGVSEPVINTAVVNGDYRIVLELPGVDINEAKEIVGTTAELSFWEQAPPEGNATTSAGFRKTNLSGNDLKNTSISFDPNTGKPQVQLVFTDTGAKKFAEITGKNIGKPLAMVLDNQLLEDPPPIVNQQIFGGSAVITGSFTTEQAQALSTQLNAGALPVPLISLEQKAVGPTLGKASLEKSLFAGVLGFITIVVFMVALYGRMGIVASIALLLYIGITLAIFKVSNLTPYGVTITLSGIAGLVLSVGMAVDANILIFERMKEEKRAGKNPQSVVELGFKRAWSSIRDSNISTLITSFILFEFGTGTIRGFAVVLAIGVFVSMFSAVVVTRTLLRFLYESR